MATAFIRPACSWLRTLAAVCASSVFVELHAQQTGCDGAGSQTTGGAARPAPNVSSHTTAAYNNEVQQEEEADEKLAAEARAEEKQQQQEQQRERAENQQSASVSDALNQAEVNCQAQMQNAAQANAEVRNESVGEVNAAGGEALASLKSEESSGNASDEPPAPSPAQVQAEDDLRTDAVTYQKQTTASDAGYTKEIQQEQEKESDEVKEQPGLVAQISEGAGVAPEALPPPEPEEGQPEPVASPEEPVDNVPRDGGGMTSREVQDMITSPQQETFFSPVANPADSGSDSSTMTSEGVQRMITSPDQETTPSPAASPTMGTVPEGKDGSVGAADKELTSDQIQNLLTSPDQETTPSPAPQNATPPSPAGSPGAITTPDDGKHGAGGADPVLAIPPVGPLTVSDATVVTLPVAPPLGSPETESSSASFLSGLNLVQDTSIKAGPFEVSATQDAPQGAPQVQMAIPFEYGSFSFAAGPNKLDSEIALGVTPENSGGVVAEVFAAVKIQPDPKTQQLAELDLGGRVGVGGAWGQIMSSFGLEYARKFSVSAGFASQVIPYRQALENARQGIVQ